MFTVFEFESSFWETVSVTILDIFCWIHWGTISEFHKWLWTINSYRHRNLGSLSTHYWLVYNSWTISVTCLDIFLRINWVTFSKFHQELRTINPFITPILKSLVVPLIWLTQLVQFIHESHHFLLWIASFSQPVRRLH